MCARFARDRQISPDELPEDLLEPDVGTGLQVMCVLLEESVTALAGEKAVTTPSHGGAPGHDDGSWPSAADASHLAPAGAFGRWSGGLCDARLASESLDKFHSCHETGSTWNIGN